MSTIKIDEGVRRELTHLQQARGSPKPSFNELVWLALKRQALIPLLLRYIKDRFNSWNPYDFLTWFYQVSGSPLDPELVSVYAGMVAELDAGLEE